MAGTVTIEAATRRLYAAVEALEAAVERRLEVERQEAGLSAQIHALGADRSRLAAALDGASARASTLEDVNRDVSRRLGSAMETIRTVLATHGH
ncbi:MAG TPA: DUF4164 domain-containing protein [Xanthobacteraceae bacterium]|nr:DUF4164 domain-containing protein [Xanthobacteraceae bacterium]